MIVNLPPFVPPAPPGAVVRLVVLHGGPRMDYFRRLFASASLSPKPLF